MAATIPVNVIAAHIPISDEELTDCLVASPQVAELLDNVFREQLEAQRYDNLT